MARVLIIDNFDSFTNNIADDVHQVTGERPIILENTTPYGQLPLDVVDAIVISPGPGHPARAADFGVCRDVIERCPLPILGVCLGHQGIAEAFGGRVDHAPTPAHGLVDHVLHDGTGLFASLPAPLRVVRYHSLVVTEIPDCLEVTARTADGLVMALRHRRLPIWGVQFHPESIETQSGRDLLRNFIEMAAVAKGPIDRSGGSDVRTAFLAVGGSFEPCLDDIEVPWPDDLATHFRTTFGDSAGAFWLDAAGSDHPDAGFSVMGGGDADVTIAYDVRSRTMTLDGPHGTRTVVGDVFTLIDDLLAGMSSDGLVSSTNVPYRTGLVGYLGYELKALCMKDPGRRELRGASARHTSTLPDAALLWPAEFTVFDHRAHRATHHSRVGFRPVRATTGTEGANPSTPLRPGPVQSFRPGPVDERLLRLRDDRARYLAKIDTALDLIRDGESYEICLTNTATLPRPSDPLHVYERMRSIGPVPHGAYLRLPEVTLLSSSPEAFLRIDDDGRVLTRPIKGTRPRHADPDTDAALRDELASSRKDRAENLMIVDLARHDLNSVCEPGTVAVPELFQVQSFSSVHQLVSTVTGQRAAGTSSLEVIRACFPPGSMTGAPKLRTMALIDTLEDAARGPYSGALGWLDASGAVVLSVVIRTLVIDDHAATLGIGGAITALSVPEDEFVEALVKASVPYQALRAAERAIDPVSPRPTRR
jgi:para-aminobenzoate synthetase